MSESAVEGAATLKSLLEEFGAMADDLARRHRLPPKLVNELLDLEGILSAEADQGAAVDLKEHVEAVLRAHAIEAVGMGTR